MSPRASNPYIAPELRGGATYDLHACSRRSCFVMLGLFGAQAAALYRAGTAASAGNPIRRDHPRWVQPRRGTITDRHGAILADGVQRDRYRRVYPYRLASHVVGFVGSQGAGVEGVERTFDTVLAGARERMSMLRDAYGRVVARPESTSASQPARNLRLTLDLGVQAVVERALANAVQRVEAHAGHVVALRPDSGAIIALASHPTFASAEPGSDASMRWNHAVGSSFEPGSVMKTFVIAGALAAGAIDPDVPFDCQGGVARVGRKTITDTHENHLLTPRQILVKSSNVGAMKVGAALGRRALLDTYRSFGFGARTGITLPVESAGVLRDCRRWSELDAATMAFGQGLSVTNLQLAAAMGAIANEGRLMVPYLVDAIMDEHGGVVMPTEPQVRTQAVPADVARQVTAMLTGVTQPHETGEDAAVPGVVVAGKTGTAQKAVPGRGYVDGVWTATFAGFFPAERPVLAVSVVIDEPRRAHAGGSVAGPVFREIAAHVMGVAP